jgi:plastocyanin
MVSRIHRLLFLIFAVLISAKPAHAQAIIEGHVQLPKAPAAAVMNQRYSVVTSEGAVSISPPLAVVYLEGTFSEAKPTTTAQVIQRDYTFVPAILPVQVGTRVQFPNEDKAYHNIFSYSPAKRFDLGRYRGDERPIPSEVFNQAGLVTLRCDIHDHMRAIILVLDTPYFVLSDTAGNFRLTGLPPGHYTLKVWLSSKTTLERAVDLQPGSTQRVDIP